jgi:hypothetical protein
MQFVTKKTLPPNLDTVAAQWREYLADVPLTSHVLNLEAHVEGKFSAYEVSFHFIKYEESARVYYAGMTSRDPTKRASEHKSELKRCKTTTFVGKSALYSAKYLDGVQSIEMTLTVRASGLDTKAQAEEAEKALSAELERLYGKEAVLTQPRGNKKSGV